MRKWIAILFLGLFLHDVVIDAVAAECAEETAVSACHTCACGPHFAVQQPSADFVEVQLHALPVSDEDLAPIRISRSLYRPPKALA